MTAYSFLSLALLVPAGFAVAACSDCGARTVSVAQEKARESRDLVDAPGTLRMHAPAARFFRTNGAFRQFKATVGFDPAIHTKHSYGPKHVAGTLMGFRVYAGAHSAATATDMGYMKKSVIKALSGVDILLLESNHDPDLLMLNPHYSLYLKQRILGNHGHLSNLASAEGLLELMNTGVREVMLGHLSGENNTPELALATHTERLGREGVRVGEDVHIGLAWRDRVSKKFEIE